MPKYAYLTIMIMTLVMIQFIYMSKMKMVYLTIVMMYNKRCFYAIIYIKDHQVKRQCDQVLNELIIKNLRQLDLAIIISFVDALMNK